MVRLGKQSALDYLQLYKVMFLVALATKILNFAPKYRLPWENMVEFGKINLALIALTVFTYLTDELILTVYWYLYNLQPCIGVILCGTITHILSVPPKCECGDLSTAPHCDWLIG